MAPPVLILMVIFGSITIWRLMAMRHKERMAVLRQGPDGAKMLMAADQASRLPAHQRGQGDPRDKTIAELEERIRHLETIVCSVDFELNAKLNRLASRQIQLDDTALLALGEGSGSAGGASTSGAGSRSRAKALFTLEPGQQLSGRFRIERALGQGGMGAVYLAFDEQLRELVALKIMHGMALLDPKAEDRLRREASAARRISHPNVVKIYDVGEDQGHLYLSMEYVEGASLAQLVSRHGPLSVERVRDYVMEICAGLAAAHEQGVVHRDLKPANVIVTSGQQVKIIDFGLARIASLEGMTATGMLMGTPEYMAPEQIKGGPNDARTDLYALGALTYHLLTGRPPFTGETPIAVSLAQATETAQPPSALRPGLDTAWDGFVLRALSKDRGQRYASAQEMRDALPPAA